VDLRRAGRRADVELQVVLRALGRLGDNLGLMLEALGWLDAVPEFLRDHSGHPFGAAERQRIDALDRDVEGLRRQAEDSTLRAQMLIDATMGAINLRQGAVVKVLSVVATVFLPPTLIASAYGMNFANMPELSQPWGYPVAVVAMLASAILPYVYMKARGWL
jgi:magnesium transporter